MLDIIARLIISAGIMMGAAYLPALSPAAGLQAPEIGSTRDGRPCGSVPGARPSPRACAA